MNPKKLIVVIAMCVGAVCTIGGRPSGEAELPQLQAAFSSQQEYKKAQKELADAIKAFKSTAAPHDEALVKLMDAMARQLTRLGQENIRLSEELSRKN